MKIPEFLIQAIKNNTTSLGDHPAFPPEEEETFVAFLLKTQYKTIMSMFNEEDTTTKTISKKLSELLTECQKIEATNKEALEKLCSDICTTIFEIPEDTIEIESHLVEECDMSKYRMTPESTPDFSFNDIDEMKYLSDEIYKRRMVNALITGASMYYGTNIEYYIREVYKINPKLVSLYTEIAKYNLALLYNQPDTIKNIERNCGGKVDVYFGNSGERVKIEAEGVIFPVLLEYTVRGLFETAAQQGLPEDKEKIEYILNKSDYRLAENWDMRLGIPLWSILMSDIEKCDGNLDEIGSNFIIMEISRLKPEAFNLYLQNAFKQTKKGLSMTKELIDTIQYNKEVDDFDNFMQAKNSKYSINDNSEYTASELLKEIEQN
ncbi:MAG: hypothetical protein IKO56_01540 [Alphaproteobacteria bacterium]|nr:hypothetical protein [Alphaproteobacteria bacterium]